FVIGQKARSLVRAEDSRTVASASDDNSPPENRDSNSHRNLSRPCGRSFPRSFLRQRPKPRPAAPLRTPTKRNLMKTNTTAAAPSQLQITNLQLPITNPDSSPNTT